MANSKKKGSRFELKVSKWFTKWTSFKFGRTPYSGANHQSRDCLQILCVRMKDMLTDVKSQ